MKPQDVVLTTVGFVFMLTLVPLVISKRTAVSRLVSVPTSLGLLATAITYMTMGLWVSAAMSTITSGLWWAVAAYRTVPRKETAGAHRG